MDFSESSRLVSLLSRRARRNVSLIFKINNTVGVSLGALKNQFAHDRI